MCSRPEHYSFKNRAMQSGLLVVASFGGVFLGFGDRKPLVTIAQCSALVSTEFGQMNNQHEGTHSQSKRKISLPVGVVFEHFN